jgi:glycosyltransferase involved in cell wall biosynthesis
MKIIYIHQYFKTFEEGGAIRSYYLTQKLAKEGHEVHIITSFNEKKYIQKIYKGTTVHYLPIFYDNRLNKTARIKSFLKFFYQSYILAKKLLPADLIYATSTPLSVGLTAYFLRKKVPYIFEVRDLWPEVPEALGILKNKLLLKIIYFYQKKIYKNAKKIIALSPAMLEGIEKRGIEKEKIKMIPNFAEVDFWKDESSTFQFSPQNKILLYAGTLGFANDLRQMLELAEFAHKNKIENWQFFIVGEGSEKEKLLKEKHQKQLKNIFFFDYMDKYNLKNIMQKASAFYISFLQNTALEANSPNKFFDALASGKIVITNTKGWIKNIIEENHCGFYYDSQKPADFFLQWDNLENKNLIFDFSRNAQKVAEKEFDTKILVEKWYKFLDI